jgi:hypothetical protein
MSKDSMAALRARRSQLGLVQMNLWIRDEDRAAFAAAVEPFKRRAAELDQAQQPGRKRLEATMTASLHSGRLKAQTPSGALLRPVGRRPLPRPSISIPCRLIFPSKPPAYIRNTMKDDGWTYDKLTGTWTADRAELVEAWIEELIYDWHAKIISTKLI